MTAKERRDAFVIKMQGMDVPIVGSVCWWNIRNVDLTKAQFIERLVACGLDEKYAKEHNYRSAFIRALRNLEEDRIIRKVSEDDNLLVYQFTAERLTSGSKAQPGELRYEYETRVIINKDVYFRTKSFAAAIVAEMGDFKANPEINRMVLELYEREKVRYRSSDVTRYVQRILADAADIVTLRDQGNIYFVPSRYQSVVERVSRLVNSLSPTVNDSRFEWLPVPDAEGTRATVSRAVLDELDGLIRMLAEEIQRVDPGLSDAARLSWINSRLARVQRIRQRITNFDGVVTEDKVAALTKEAVDLEARILGVRKLDL